MNITRKSIIGIDIDFDKLDGCMCKVSKLVSADDVVSQPGVIPPYSYVEFLSNELMTKTGVNIALLPIFHKVDYQNLSSAIKIADGQQEILFVYYKNNFKYKIYKLFSAFLPKLWVMMCPENAYVLMKDRSNRANLNGEAYARAVLPIRQWKPPTMMQ